MRQIRKIAILALMPALLTACYDDYTMDYDYSAAYVAYQYDLRTFVLDGSESFDFTVALGGVVENLKDRTAKVEIDDKLLTGDLSIFAPEGEDVDAFTALDGLTGKAPFGTLCQAYVSTEVSAADLAALTPLPQDYYTTSLGPSGTVSIDAGRHTGTVTIKASDAIKTDPKAFKPYYAIGLKVVDADVDKLVREKSFAVIAIKCENEFYGNWYHGGTTTIVDVSTGSVVSNEDYHLTLPQTDDEVYILSTIDANSVKTNKVGRGSGSLLLTFEGEDITVSSADGSKEISPVEGRPSRSNGARNIQDRQLYLNYSYSNPDGTIAVVSDTLSFRNRVRDGINEWQDENPQ